MNEYYKKEEKEKARALEKLGLEGVGPPMSCSSASLVQTFMESCLCRSEAFHL